MKRVGMKSHNRLVALFTLILSIAGCSSESIYYSLRSMQKDSCNSNPDSFQRDRCLKEQDVSYDKYQKERAGTPSHQASGSSR